MTVTFDELDEDRMAEAQEALLDLCSFPTARHHAYGWIDHLAEPTCAGTPCPHQDQCTECGDQVCTVHHSPTNAAEVCEHLGAMHTDCHSMVCAACPLF